jgi:hypothetical protein
LAEYSGNHISLEMLRNRLMPHATNINVVMPSMSSLVITILSSSATVIWDSLVAYSPAAGTPVGTSLEVEYVS